MTPRLFALPLALASFSLSASSPLVKPGEVLTPERCAEVRRVILDHFFVPSPLPPVDGQIHKRFVPAPGVSAEGVSYATESGLRVPAILYLPDPLPKDRLPALLVVNGHGGDKYSWYSYYAGILYARAGMAVLTYDQAGEGERNAERKSGTRAHDHIKGGELLARRLCGLMITDAMEGVSYLQSRPEVDPSRIAEAGYSLGSFVVALSGAVDPRPRACILNGGGNLGGPEGYWDRVEKQMCEGLPYHSLEFLGDRPSVLYALQADRGPTLVWNGRVDTVVNMVKTQEPFFDDLKARTTALHGSPRQVFEYGFTPKGSHRPYFLTKPDALWLSDTLHFPLWTRAQIEAMPETHISEWAKATGGYVEKLYASEEREGGTMALGEGIPALPRSELNVFSDTAWPVAKDRFLFSEWVTRARAEEGVTDPSAAAP